MKKFCLLFCIAFIGALQAESQNKAGFLDSSFGLNGVTTLKGLSRTFDGLDAAQQTDGKTICVGSLFAAVRLDKAGHLDSGFGNHGEFFLTSDVYFALTGNAVVIQPDNKIIITGTGIRNFSSPNYDMVTIRLTANGTLDSSFGTNGVVTADFGTGDVSYDVVLQADKKILIQGSSSGNFNTLRLQEDGSLDKGFGSSGSVITKFGAPATGFGIALQPDGKIVAVGATDEKAILARYLSDGSVDASFGTNGKVSTKLENQITLGRDVVIQTDGKIVVTGNLSRIISDSLYLARYNEDGSVDETFGNNGSVVPAFQIGSVSWKLALQQDDKIVICGYTNDGNSRHFLLSRFQTNGTIDSSFANSGLQQTAILANDGAYGLILTNDNKIVLAGTSKDETSDYPSIAQYNNNAKNKKQIIITKIKHWIQNHNLYWQTTNSNDVSYYTIERSSNLNNSFVKVATVFSNEKTTYSYSDNNPVQGKAYYRVTAVASNGNTVSSNITSDIRTAVLNVSLSPNPVKSMLSIKGLNRQEKYRVTITNANGNLIASQELHGTSVYDLNVINFNNGIYYISLASTETPIHLKFSKE